MIDYARALLRENGEAVAGLGLVPLAVWCLWRAWRVWVRP